MKGTIVTIRSTAMNRTIATLKAVLLLPLILLFNRELNAQTEVKSIGSHSATVKLTKRLKVEVIKLSNHLSYDGKSFGSYFQIAHIVKEFPKVWSFQLFRNPEATKEERNEEPVAAGKPFMMYARSSSADMATMGDLFSIPIEALIGWRSFPAMPIGNEFKITPLGCFTEELVNYSSQPHGVNKPNIIQH
jgi:hypothetical protein